MHGQSLFRTKESPKKAQFRSVNNLRTQVAKDYRLDVNRVVHGNGDRLFVPFVNQRRLGKLVLQPITTPSGKSLEKGEDPARSRATSKPLESTRLHKGSPTKTWQINTVNARPIGVKSPRYERALADETPKDMLASSNAYEKTNMLVYRSIKKAEPPESIPNEDRELVNDLYESYKRIKQFTENIRRLG